MRLMEREDLKAVIPKNFRKISMFEAWTKDQYAAVEQALSGKFVSIVGLNMKSLRKYFKAGVMSVATLFLLASNAWANYSCIGPVYGVAIDVSGSVYAGSIPGGNWTQLCQISGTVNGVGPESCKAIYTLLITAQTTGRQVQMWFNDNLTCTTHPAWNTLTGWYFGPQLLN